MTKEAFEKLEVGDVVEYHSHYEPIREMIVTQRSVATYGTVQLFLESVATTVGPSMGWWASQMPERYTLKRRGRQIETGATTIEEKRREQKSMANEFGKPRVRAYNVTVVERDADDNTVGVLFEAKAVLAASNDEARARGIILATEAKKLMSTIAAFAISVTFAE